MVSFHSFPRNVELLPAAAKDLDKISQKDRANFKRICEDIVRLGQGTLPPQGRKRLHKMEAFQFDCGRFRVVYSFRNSIYLILAVFTKSEQKRRFKGWL